MKPNKQEETINMKKNPVPYPAHLRDQIAYYHSLGHIVPPARLLKTPEQIEGIRRSSQINIAVLDFISNNIRYYDCAD